MGGNYFKNGKTDKAIFYIQKSLEINPDYFLANHLLGIIYQEEEIHGKAIENFLKALRLDSNNPSLYYALGVSYYENGDYHKAIKNLKIH